MAAIKALSSEDLKKLHYCWPFWARPEQIAPPGDWDVWVVCAGRGFGKTRIGAEWICQRVAEGAQRLTIVGRTAADVRDVMVEGESGILRCSPPWNRPDYKPSTRRLTWPNGAQATTYSADEPDQMRGPQGDTAWADELAAWQFPDAWDQLALGLRSLQSKLRPQAVVTTTPRPTPLVRQLIADPTSIVTRGSTYDNAANLASSFLDRIKRRYEGTRLGRQELYAQILDDSPGALFQRETFERCRVRNAPELRSIVIAVDPAVSTGEDADETGIVVAGLGEDGHGYVLADHSGRYSPNEWAQLVVRLYDKWEADRVIAEVNQGGDLVESNLRTAKRELPITKVHASKGKRTRAEPVATLYEQSRVHHVGTFASLEDQCCTWEPDVLEGGKHHKTDSPDRLDALVYAITHMMVDKNPNARATGRRPRLNYAIPLEERTFGH